MATWELLYSNVTPKPVNYKKSIISYIDILGFRELIQSKSAGEISKILRILAESVEPHRLLNSERTRFTKFSDTIIRSTAFSERKPQTFLFELRHILHSHIALIPQGIIVRGAVTIGDVVQSWRVVYGQGVVRAYELESKNDSAPRIIIDTVALEKLRLVLEKEGLDVELNALIRTEHSVTYLDYLRACEVELNVPEQEYPWFLGLHRDLIRSCLRKYGDRPGVLQKYEWLKVYHNRTLVECFGTAVPNGLEV
jgi:hypothetical protein